MHELLPPSRSDRFRSVGLIVGLLAPFALISALVNDDASVTVVAAEPSVDGSTEGDVAPAGPLDGEFLISGSSTVYPIVLEQAEAFSDANDGVAISVEGPGSGEGRAVTRPPGASRHHPRAWLQAELLSLPCQAAGCEY